MMVNAPTIRLNPKEVQNFVSENSFYIIVKSHKRLFSRTSGSISGMNMEWFRQTEVPALQRNTKARQAESAEDKIFCFSYIKMTYYPLFLFLKSSSAYTDITIDLPSKRFPGVLPPGIAGQHFLLFTDPDIQDMLRQARKLPHPCQQRLPCNPGRYLRR